MDQESPGNGSFWGYKFATHFISTLTYWQMIFAAPHTLKMVYIESPGNGSFWEYKYATQFISTLPYWKNDIGWVTYFQNTVSKIK